MARRRRAPRPRGPAPVRRGPALRVIAGTAGGRRLVGPSSESTRPLSDRAREALGNILAARWADARVLDLFAGTGAVGIEALSRGAAAAVFVERDPVARSDLEANLGVLDPGADARVEAGDALGYVARAPTPFDIIFSGPPQWQGLAWDTLAVIDRHADTVLAGGGVVITQLDPEEDADEPPLAALERTDTRTYGRVRLLFHQRRTTGRLVG